MKKIYVIKETCPLWDDGTGEDYERILPYVFLDEKAVNQCKIDLEMIACETYNCCEYEIKEINSIESIETYEEDDKYKIHGRDNLERIDRQFLN